MARLIIGIVVGILLSFVATALFTEWATYAASSAYFGTNVLLAISKMAGVNFEFDILSLIMSGSYTVNTIFAPQLLAWILIGYVSGTIAKGVKRGLMAGLITLVIVLLIWILFAVISGEDLMAMFAGAQLNTTLGGILTGVIGAVLGGLLGGMAGGSYEEFY